jgi:hypothetical protein
VYFGLGGAKKAAWDEKWLFGLAQYAFWRKEQGLRARETLRIRHNVFYRRPKNANPQFNT